MSMDPALPSVCERPLMPTSGSMVRDYRAECIVSLVVAKAAEGLRGGARGSACGSVGGGAGPGLWHWEVLGGSFAGGAVDRFAEEVGVAGVAGVLLDHVGQQPTQAHPGVGRLIELTVGQRLVQ